MKVFALQINGETEWMAADTIIEALQKYISITGIELTEFDKEDDIKEVTSDKWEELKVMCYDREFQSDQTFAEVMKHLQAPDIIALPCYDYAPL